MKIWIPKRGDEVRLDQDWTFTLHPEYRNTDFVRRSPASAEEVESNNAGPIAAHVDGIIRTVVQHVNSSASYPFYGNAQANGIRQIMINGKHWRRSGKEPEAWTIDSTKENDDGTTVRNIRFFCQGRKFGGFTVTSKGAEICGVAPPV
jgi:hypothetical protein